MLTRSLARSGGIASLAQAAAYVTASLAAMAIPLEQVTGSISGLVAFQAQTPLPLHVLAASLIALAVLGIGAVVPATGALLGGEERAWVVFGRNLALLALGIIAVYYTWYLWTLDDLVNRWEAAETETRRTLELMNPRAPANWVAWFMFGGMGLWVVIVAVEAARQRALPRPFVAACVVKAGGFWLALVGVVSGNLLMARVGTALGALIGGTWYHVWLGLHLLRRKSTLT